MVIEDPELLLPVPEGVPMDCAATAMCGGVTAHNSVQSVRQSVDEAIKLRGKPVDLNPSPISHNLQTGGCVRLIDRSID